LSVLQSCSARKCGRQSLSTTSNTARPVYSLPSSLTVGGGGWKACKGGVPR
jgi:hypothetical protein